MSEILIASILHSPHRFLRSTDLVRDFEDSKGLEDYWLTDFGRTCLIQIADGFRPESGHRAWRLTGDFGSGKSSFALLLATALRDPMRLPHGLRTQVLKSMPIVKKNSYVPVLVTGCREPMSFVLVRALHSTMSTLYTRGAKSALLEEMEQVLIDKRVSDQKALELLVDCNSKLIQSGKGSGILLILDEVGKFLEFAALYPEKQDVYFLQQLAEKACRSGKQPFAVICLLHQGFNAYAEQLAKSTRQEWDKIAGRFDEISFHQPLDQIAQLVASAIRPDLTRLTDLHKKQAVSSLEQAIKLGWYGTTASRETLRMFAERLFPLDPLVLPVLVRVFRRFGQNERSLFGFTCSHEPFGLRAFSQQPLHSKTRPYQLSDLYDYVRANFGYRLGAASYRTHWNIIESTIESFQPKDPLELRALKTVGLLNLLSAEDLLPTEDAVTWAVAGASVKEQAVVAAILRKMAGTPILHFRGKGRGYSIWAHSSVDLDMRLEDAKRANPTVGSISEAIVAQLPSQPIVARAHYIKTGNLRFFDVVFCQPDALEQKAVDYKTRADGYVLVPLCETSSDTKSCEKKSANLLPRTDTIRLVAVPQPLNNLKQAVMDAQNWEWVQLNTPELNNDRIARDEVTIYLQEARYRLQNQIQNYLGLNRYSGESSLKWFYFDHEGKAFSRHLRSREVLEILSFVCDEAFTDAPTIKNEMVNRHNISPAAAGARMRLIDLMFTASNKPDLGLPPDRKPPEKSMYFSVLMNTKMHRERGGVWKVGLPEEGEDPDNVRPVLNRMKALLSARPDTRIPIQEMLDDLRRPPYGLRDGLFPILLTVIAIEGEHEIAFYENGTFLRDVGKDAFLRMSKAPDKFEIQLCKIEGIRSVLFHQLTHVLEISRGNEEVELLDVVRNLCQFVARLPEYSRNTKYLDPVTLAVREVIMQAREPVRMVFHDLPEACGFSQFVIGKAVSTTDAQRFVQALKRALDELRSAFLNLQRRIAAGVGQEFDYGEQATSQYRRKLSNRAEQLLVSVTENKLKAFVFRLFDEGLSESEWLSSVGSVLALRPPEQWKDEDENVFKHELENAAGRFKRTESAAFARGGVGHGLRVAITQADGTERQEVVHVDAGDEKQLAQFQEQILSIIKKNPRLGLAAASRVIWAQLKTLEDV